MPAKGVESYDAAVAEWDRLISDFEASIQARGLSPRTVDHYSENVKRVLKPYCLREGISPAALTKRHLEHLAAELLDSGKARQSVKTYLAAVNRFLKWCQEEGELDGELHAPEPKVGRRVLDVLTREEIQRIEDAAGGERDKLIVRVLGDTGMRMGELRRLRITDLVAQGRQRYLRVRGKGSDERLVPVTPGLYARLDRYVRRGRPDSASDALFLTLNRRPSGDHEPVSQEVIGQLVKHLARKAGISKRVHPHLFRHSVATHMLRRNTNPLLVRDILGHTSLAMIDRVYSHLVPNDAHDAMMEAFREDD